MNYFLSRKPGLWLAAIFVSMTNGLVDLNAAAQTSHPAEKPPFGIVIHGGAGTIRKGDPGREAQYRAALQEALQIGYSVLDSGGTSLDAVTAAIAFMEDSPLFNAGRGAVLNRDGKVELDASLMEGKTLAAGAVTGVKETKNPILLARSVMENTPHVMLAGDAADAFARTQGFPRIPNKYFETEQRLREWEQAEEKEQNTKRPQRNKSRHSISDADTGFGTVGAVALDRHGNLAAGTSTGGRLNKMPGRVGDTPIIGAGTYANNRTCAVSATGHGEYFIRATAASRVSNIMEFQQRDVKSAAETALAEIKELGGTGGLIVIDRHGRVAFPFNTPGMYRGYQIQGGKATIEIW